MISSALAALVLAAGGPRPEASLAAGAGYETNLNHVDETQLAVGASFLAVRGTGGLALDVGDSTGLYGGLRLDAEQYPELADLTTGSAGVEAFVVQELGSAVAVVLAPAAFASWSGDRARDATGAAGQITVRVRPVRPLALRVFYGHTRIDAEDPVFSSERDRIGASVEWRMGPGAYLALGYAAERGDEVFYRPTTETTWGGMRHRVDTFGDAEEAYSAPADAHSIRPSLEVALGGAVHLQASYELRVVRSAPADFTTHSVFAGLGVRL